MPVRTHTQKPIRSDLPGISTVAARLLTPAWLMALAGLQIADATTDVLPIWMAGMGVRFGVEPDWMLRGLLGAELLFAGLMLLIGRWARTLAVIALAFACFSAIASISAAPQERTSVLLGVLVLGISGLLLALVLRRPVRPGQPLSLQWQAIGAVAVAVIAGTVAVQLPIRVVDESLRGRFRPIRPPEAVELDFGGLVGHPFTESPVKRYLPQLTAATLDGATTIVFYSPRCGMCHDLFRERFSTPIEGKLIAVRVPPEPDASLLPSDQPEEVECPQCTFMELPEGPVWLVQPPYVVEVLDGIVKSAEPWRGG